ncbi:hypothetical protein ACIHFE_00780 [Streptomyces sp. NPDC052396]|uniref:hypothetical protein n=1 Tax=Streptomyces sp. NPDC052396 TaxID=3365689 RepID=UPI0037CDB710
MNAFHLWYEQLTSLDRDIVLQHFCADAPLPLEELARRHALDWEHVRFRRNVVALSLDGVLARDRAVGEAIAQAERDLQTPCETSALLRRHPLLADRLGERLTVLQLLTGLRWQGAADDPTGQWSYDGDLGECAIATARALDLAPGESISLPAACRLLDQRAVPIPEAPDTLRSWLTHCGFTCDDRQVSAPLPASGEGAPAAPADLAQHLQRLANLLQINENLRLPMTLGEVLQKANEFHDDLGATARSIRDSLLGATGGWMPPAPGLSSQLEPTECHAEPGPELVTGRSRSFEEAEEAEVVEDNAELLADDSESALLDAAGLVERGEVPTAEDVGAFPSIVDRIVAVLDAEPKGLTTSRIKGALGPSVSQTQVAKVLFANDCFAITLAGTWYLLREPAESPAEAPAPAAELDLIAEAPAAATVQEELEALGSAHAFQLAVQPTDPVEGARIVDAPSAEPTAAAPVPILLDASAATQDDDIDETEDFFLASPGSPSSTREAQRAAWLKQLIDEAHGILARSAAPLSSREILATLGREGQLRTLRQGLVSDRRFVSAGWDTWTIDVRGTGTSRRACGDANLYGGTRRDDDRLDAVEAVLRKADHSLTLDELKTRAGVSIGASYLKQQIDADPRFSRSQKDQWALTEWGLPMYKPIKELVSDMVDEHGGAVDADEVVRVLCRDFGVKESSLRQTMSSPPFTARGGVVRRLTDGLATEPSVTPTHASQPRSNDSAPDVDDLMNKMGLI